MIRDIIRQIACGVCKALSGPRLTTDVPSPRDIIPKADISYDSLTCVLEIRHIPPSVWLTTVQDTNSMDPTVDVGHTCILTNNIVCEDLAVGDVVVYEIGRHKIIHRIIKIEKDSKGRKYTLKGDNNTHADHYIVRDEHIKWLLLGILY